VAATPYESDKKISRPNGDLRNTQHIGTISELPFGSPVHLWFAYPAGVWDREFILLLYRFADGDPDLWNGNGLFPFFRDRAGQEEGL
jgi:hypothetical protein